MKGKEKKGTNKSEGVSGAGEERSEEMEEGEEGGEKKD